MGPSMDLRHAFVFALTVPLYLSAAATGCTSSSSGPADGSVAPADAEPDVSADAEPDVSAEDSGPADCVAAGGQCVVGPGVNCGKIGPQNCNPDHNPGGAVCCLAECTDANTQTIQASNYDQSCSADSDCVAVGEGNACFECALVCANAAINVAAHAQYLADVAKTFAGSKIGGGCAVNCPANFGGCCRAGTCHADFQCATPADAGTDAAADASLDAPADAAADAPGE
jgi:hypothetical protein